MRITLWCTTLVVVSGTIVVLLTILITDQQLRKNAPERQPSSVSAVDGRGDRPGSGRGPTPGSAPGLGVDSPRADRRIGSASGANAADLTLDYSRRVGLQVLAGMAVMSLFASWVVAERALRPVRSLSRAAARISSSRLSDRINHTGPRDELKELADNFDAMLARLDSAFETQRSFVADASHELRTPLAIMRAEVDVALDDPEANSETLRDAISAIGASLQRMQDLSESLLSLARSEVQMTTVAVDLADVTESAIQTLQQLGFVDRVVTSRCDPAVVEGDPVLLERLAFNLIENAIRHNCSGGSVNISTSSVGGSAVLAVENDGDQITDDEIGLLFRRFSRRPVDAETVAGHGVGLAVAAAIVTAHEGSLVAVARPGGGLAARVTLPRFDRVAAEAIV